MKKDTPRIKRSQLPCNLPVMTTIVLWLLLDRLNSPGWVWGIVGTLVAILWLGAFYAICTSREVDVIGNR